MMRRRKQKEADLDRELRAHLDLETEEQRDSGLPGDQARYAAVRALGNITSIKETVRPMWTGALFERFWRNARYALRAMRKDSRFTIAATISLALGIGANTAIFTVVNGALLRPLPYPDPDRLFSVQEAGSKFGTLTSYPDFDDWRSQNHVWSAMATYHGSDFTLTSAEPPVRIAGAVVGAELLSVLHVSPVLGRGFQAEDDKPGARVVLLSNHLWQTRFHSDSGIVGRPFMLGRQQFTVIGVMPAGFQFPPTAENDLWTTSAVDAGPPKVGRGYNWLSVIARLKPGVTRDQAQADMDLIARRLAQQYPRSNARRTSVRLTPELDRIVGDSRQRLAILFGVVTGILLIACTNVANLLIARNLARRKEMTVRAALGASRGTLIAQLLTESVLLAIVGGTCGIVLALWSTRALTTLAPTTLPRVSEMTVDGQVLAFAAALSILTGLFFGLMPALRISRVNIGAGLKEARHSASEGPRQHRLRSLLVVTQTAVAVVLTLAATLLMASYLRLTHVAPGFDHSNVLTFNFDLPSTQYTPERALAFFDDLLGRLKQLPDVNAAAASWPVPFAGGDPSSGFEVEGRQYRAGLMPSARVHIISPGYFQTMRIRMDGGRDFTDHDVMSSLPIAIVDEAFAQTYFPNENALHKRIRPGIAMSDVPPWREIVGIVNSTKERALAEDFQPQYYIPYAQLPGPEPGVVVKTAGSPLTIAPLLPRLLASMDKTVPVYDVRTMDERLSLSVESERFNAFLFGLFGILAAVLAAVGIYGVANCTVNQAVHEIGIRMALGAQAGDVLRLTLIKAARNVAIGIAAGIAVALTLSRLLTTLLYGVKPNDPAMLLAACTGFAIVALIASYIPARRATRIDPMAVLRNE